MHSLLAIFHPKIPEGFYRTTVQQDKQSNNGRTRYGYNPQEGALWHAWLLLGVMNRPVDKIRKHQSQAKIVSQSLFIAERRCALDRLLSSRSSGSQELPFLPGNHGAELWQPEGAAVGLADNQPRYVDIPTAHPL